MNVLHLDSSPLAGQSVSRELTAKIVASLVADRADTKVVYRDLASNAPGHLSGDALATRFVPVDDWTPAQRAEAALSEAILSELLAADVIVVGAPMYNFSVPSQLKVWIDRVAVAGRTFKYTETGPVGLLSGKKVIVASTRGGMYSTSEGGRAMDFQEDYLKAVFGFIGITEVEIIRAEGVAMGGEAKAKAMAGADQAIAGLAAKAA